MSISPSPRRSTYKEKLLIPQGGIRQSRVRCLDAKNGELLWEAPFTGSPGWSRQFPPVVHGNVAIYASGSGEYAAQGSEKAFVFKGEPEPTEDGREVMSWIFANADRLHPEEPQAPGLGLGSRHGRGRLAQGFFGVWPRRQRQRHLHPRRETLLLRLLRLRRRTEEAPRPARREQRLSPPAWIPPRERSSGRRTDYHVTSKCTLSARDGRIYIGGFAAANQEAGKGPLRVVSRRERRVAGLAVGAGDLRAQCGLRRQASSSSPTPCAASATSNDRETGKIANTVGHNYACCRFTLSEPYVLGANMDMIDLSQDGKLVSTGPAIDSRECLGAVVSNGRIFYMSQASGFIVSRPTARNQKTFPRSGNAIEPPTYPSSPPPSSSSALRMTLS